MLRFAVAFSVVAGTLLALYTFPYAESGISERWFSDYLSAYARLAGSALSVVEPGVTVHGQSIAGRFSLEIVKSCDAMEVNILFAAAVLAFPRAWAQRLMGVALGIPLLVALNVVRICSLYYIGVRLPDAFELFHLELWPLVLVTAATGAFLVWASWTRPSGSVPSAATPSPGA